MLLSFLELFHCERATPYVFLMFKIVSHTESFLYSVQIHAPRYNKKALATVYLSTAIPCTI